MVGEQPDQIEQRFAALLQVSGQLFPQTVLGTGDQDEWLVVGPALIARATRSLEALRALRPLDLDCDAYTVLRSLYEHVTRFAYLAANPGEHLPLWLKWDRSERLSADNDMLATTGETFIEQGARMRLTSEKDAIPGQPLGLRQQADKADEHWTKEIAEHSGKATRYGLAGVYRTLYRHSSAIAHGTAYGLQTMIESGAPGTLIVGVEQPAVHSPYRLGQVVYMMGLLVYAKAFSIDGMLEALDQIAPSLPCDTASQETPIGSGP